MLVISKYFLVYCVSVCVDSDTLLIRHVYSLYFMTIDISGFYKLSSNKLID